MISEKGAMSNVSGGPKLFYGWLIVVAGFMVTTVTLGAQYSFGVFLKPLLDEFSLTRAGISLVLTVYMLVHAVATFVMGTLADRYGTRLVVGFGGFLLGVAMFLTAQVTSAWQLYLFYSFMAGIGVSCAFVPLTATTARWFIKKKGLVQGIVGAGIGMGTLIMAPLSQWLIQTYGWRVSYTVIGLLVWVVVIPLSFIFRYSPDKMGLAPYGSDSIDEGTRASNQVASRRPTKQVESDFSVAARTIPLWLLFFSLFAWGFTFQTIMAHFVVYATDIGLPAMIGATVLGTIGGVCVVGRISVGAIADKVNPRGLLIGCFALNTAMMFWLILSGSNVFMLYVFGALLGFAYGGIAPLLPVVVEEFFGLKALGAIMGFLVGGTLIGGIFGPPMAGYIADVTKEYRLAFFILGGLAALGVLASALVRAPKKRISRL